MELRKWLVLIFIKKLIDSGFEPNYYQTDKKRIFLTENKLEKFSNKNLIG